MFATIAMLVLSIRPFFIQPVIAVGDMSHASAILTFPPRGKDAIASFNREASSSLCCSSLLSILSIAPLYTDFILENRKLCFDFNIELCFNLYMINLPISEYQSKSAFCRAVGLSPQYLNQIEKGLRPIPPKVAISLNKLHGVSLYEMRPDIYPKAFE